MEAWDYMKTIQISALMCHVLELRMDIKVLSSFVFIFLFSDLCYTEAYSSLALPSQIPEHLSCELGKKVKLRI